MRRAVAGAAVWISFLIGGIVVLAIAVTAMVLGFFAVNTIQTAPETFTAIVGLGLLAIIVYALVRYGRRHRPSPQPPGRQPLPSPSG